MEGNCVEYKVLKRKVKRTVYVNKGRANKDLLKKIMEHLKEDDNSFWKEVNKIKRGDLRSEGIEGRSEE